ncbi:MAG: outer membrane beta-barrel protein [Paludibacteraceae bacterium]|nr:outer membrane beta-barrel protein [Paludibacteraceae bacterium]
MKQLIKYIFSALLITLLSAATTPAHAGDYLLELGAQGGMMYYVGDAQSMIFMHPRETYGGQMRYKFNRRWALQLKGQYGRIGFRQTTDCYDYQGNLWPADTEKKGTIATNQMVMLDLVGEYNFLPFAFDARSGRVRPYTPYIFLGAGIGLYDGNRGPRTFKQMSAYLPFGIGFKWKFAEHCGLQAAWQHNLYLPADNIEGYWVNKQGETVYDNTHDLNGKNFLNFDMTGSLTIGLVFDFIEAPKVCKTCLY